MSIEKTDISLNNKALPGKGYAGLRAVIKENLRGINVSLTTLSFFQGANIYVFSYDVGGIRKHTLVDAGDPQHEAHIMPLLAANDIDLNGIEKIIITHRHVDHCGLAHILAAKSDAKVLAHHNFRSFVEGSIGEAGRAWWRGFDPSKLKGCNLEYLAPSAAGESLNIGGIDFPKLGEPIEITGAGCLRILACPESKPTHTPDQIVVLFSPASHGHDSPLLNSSRPTDHVLFSGDLWLMVGPLTSWRLSDLPMLLRRRFHQIKRSLSGRSGFRMNPTEQDAKAKEALKQGFSLIRVKPGHGDEFLGSRIIPYGLLANRDILSRLGFPLNANPQILRSKDLAPRVDTLLENAYTSFAQELRYWMELGYGAGEVSNLLARIYKEQHGGSKESAKDRKQRRARIKQTLVRLGDDKTAPDELRHLARSLSHLH